MHHLAEELAEILHLGQGVTGGEVVHQGEGCLGDGTALPHPAERGDPWFVVIGQLDAQAHLVPAGGVHLEGLPVEVGQLAGAVAGAGVVHDDLLVQLLEFHHATPKNFLTLASLSTKKSTSSGVL